MSEDKYLLRVEDLSAGYDTLQVLWDVNLEVQTKESICIIGSNGAGKTTLIRNLIGIRQPWSGRIFFSGNEITDANSTRRVSLGLSVVPENRELFPALSVEDNLLLGAHLRDDNQGIQESLSLVYETFPTLEEYRQRLAGGLSGGEQQMCAIGRALMPDPKLLMIDELSLGLAPVIMDDLIDLLTTVTEEQDLTLVLVEQDVGTALEITDRGYVLETGRITLSGESSELAEEDHVKNAYLGVK